MFIKKFNKIYAPPQPKPGKAPRQTPRPGPAEHQPGNQKPLVVQGISVDPHGCYICLYSQVEDEIYLISIVTMLDYMDAYREQFAKTKHYSLKQALKPELILSNPRPSDNISQVKLSHSVQNTQFIIVGYYVGIIDIYSVLSGKRISSVTLNDSPSSAQQSLIYNFNVLGHSIFISDFQGRLMCYEGNELTPVTKYPDEWVRLGYFCGHEGDPGQQNPKNPPKKARRHPIYYNLAGQLKVGSRIVMREPKVAATKNMSDSQLEYLELQRQTVHHSGLHIKYEMTPCERFIICMNQQPLKHDGQLLSAYYSLRSRELNWAEMKDVYFRYYPVVNHFWGTGASLLEKPKTPEHPPKNAIIMNESILVATLHQVEAVVPEYKQPQASSILFPIKQECEARFTFHLQLKRITQRQGKFVVSNLLEVIDLKQRIQEAYWVGPSQLVYLGENGGVYFIEPDLGLLL